MGRIRTAWGQVELLSLNLEELTINGFRIPLDELSEYVDKTCTPNRDLVRKTVGEVLEKKDFIQGQEGEFNIDCIEENYGQEIKTFWKIRFEVVEYHGPQRGKMKLVKLRFAHTKRDIPFEIKNIGIWIKVGKKDVHVPIPIYPNIKSENLSVTIKLLGCCIEGIYKRL